MALNWNVFLAIQIPQNWFSIESLVIQVKSGFPKRKEVDSGAVWRKMTFPLDLVSVGESEAGGGQPAFQLDSVLNLHPLLVV